MKTNIDRGWVVKIVIISVAASITFTFASSEILGSAGYIVAFVVLALFIFFGIIFDIIGVAVTAASLAPFHSMATHREPGAAEAIRLIKNAEKVSSICGDVIGDISGIICGTMSAFIVTRLMDDLSIANILLHLLISGLVTGTIIGGKAIGKTLAIGNSTNIVLRVGKLISLRTRVFKVKRGK